MTKEEKHKLEKEAMKTIVQSLDASPEALEIESLWMEYEEAKTEEALFVKDLDKFEMIVQALEYEQRLFILYLINIRRRKATTKLF